jgi:hypothetical protein
LYSWNNQYSIFKLIAVVFHISWKSFHGPFFLKLFLHHFFYEFIDSIDLKWCIRHRLKYSERKKCFVFVCFSRPFWTTNKFRKGCWLDFPLHRVSDHCFCLIACHKQKGLSVRSWINTCFTISFSHSHKWPETCILTARWTNMCLTISFSHSHKWPETCILTARWINTCLTISFAHSHEWHETCLLTARLKLTRALQILLIHISDMRLAFWLHGWN